YTVYLTPEGVDKLKKLNPNYNWPTTEQEVGKLVIEAAQASATVSGENSRVYNGQVISTVDLYQGGNINVTIYGINGNKITYTLKDGDYNWNVMDPTNIGTYTLTLNDTGISHLQEVLTAKYGAGNVTLANSAVTGNAKFTITPAIIKISGNGSQTGTYTGSPQVVDPNNFPIRLTPEGDAPSPTIPDGTLTSDDFVVKNKDGKPVNPTNVGDYTVYLTPEGVDKLKKLNPNYNWPTTEQEVGALTITPAKMDVTLSGNDSKVSDGQPAKVDISTLVDNLTSNNLNKNGLTLADFSWNTSDGSAPIEVGNYTITLNENGLKKLQINNSNYTVNVTGEFKYTIIAASQKIEYVDGNGNIIKVIDNIGTDASNYGEKVDFDVKQNVPENYKLVNSNVPTQVTIENGVTRFVIEPNIVTTTDTKTVTRTIIVETPDGSESKVVQTVTFMRPQYTDPVNGEVTYGAWDKSSGNWSKYTAPEIPGYTSNEVPEEEVTPDTEDKTVTVKYTKNPLVETTDTKTVTRTIIVETPDGSESKVVQTVTFTRPQYTDPVNGEVTYGDWDKSSGNWSKYTAPEIPGYTLNEVPGEVVTPDTEDKTVTVKYTKNPLIETTDTKTVTRTIIVENPDGSESKAIQTVTFTRPQYTDPVNDEVTYGDWDKSSGNWSKYTALEIPGYTSNEVPGEVVTPDTEDKTVTVKYTKNPLIETTDTKTVTRTIIVENPDGSENKVDQTVTFTRPKYTDPVNGEVTYGDWDKSSGNWNKYNAPEIPDYTSNEVPEEVVTPDTADKTVTVKYTKNPLVETTDTKTVTRTIIVENPDGSENKVDQTVTFTRPKYTDLVNGEVTYGEWDKSSGSWSKYTAPEIPGYTSNEVPEEVVTPDTEDKTVTVKYTKNPLIETTDTKTVTRTIIVENPDGSESKVVQTVTFTRPQYTDPVNGEVTYGDWDKSSGSWDKYTAPEIPGYTSNEVPEEEVTPDTEDQTIRIGYSKQQEPETPTIPSQPADNKESGKVSAVKQQVSTTKISETNIVNTVQKKVGKQASRNRAQVNKKNDHTLPQTGAHKDMLAIISGALAVGIGLLGLSLDRKKKK
ncbi:MAG: MBG domain-containing protein, partial [Lactobacillus johnsonii]|nr:MBG domain-containing protein [Lactobacillus johnsonii]